MFSCLVSWLDGHSLAQTLFTCLYLHQPNQIEDKYLQSFSIAMLKLVNIIRKFVTGARVYEEEDFQPNIYNYNLCMELVDQKAVSMLKDCENDWTKKLKDAEGSSDLFEETQAVLIRLKFMRLLLQSLLLLFPSKTYSPNEIEMSEITKLLIAAADLVQPFKKTVELGTQPDKSSEWHFNFLVFGLE